MFRLIDLFKSRLMNSYLINKALNMACHEVYHTSVGDDVIPKIKWPPDISRSTKNVQFC